MPLEDVMSTALEPDTQAVDEVPYLNDVQYHMNAYTVEEALRQIGVLPDPLGAPDAKPYDKDLRKLIESVPLE